MVTIYEKSDSPAVREGDQPSIERRYQVLDITDETAALAALASFAPTSDDGLVRQSIALDPVGYDFWEGVVKYGIRKRPETNESTYAFDTTGATAKITHSLETVAAYAPGNLASSSGGIAVPGITPDFQGAIGFDGNTIQGCTKTIPTFQWTETHYKPLTFVNSSYRLTLANLTGTVNSGDFRDFSAGEVLFLGASGTMRGSEDWELQYKFVASPNVDELTLGGIGNIAKDGWDYLWVLYEDATDENTLVRVPKAVYIERIYERKDFVNLAIGTAAL